MGHIVPRVVMAENIRFGPQELAEGYNLKLPHWL